MSVGAVESAVTVFGRNERIGVAPNVLAAGSVDMLRSTVVRNSPVAISICCMAVGCFFEHDLVGERRCCRNGRPLTSQARQFSSAHSALAARAPVIARAMSTVGASLMATLWYQLATSVFAVQLVTRCKVMRNEQSDSRSARELKKVHASLT